MALAWKPLLKTVAPWIGTALGGPLGGAAVTAIGDALGLDKATEASIAKVLGGATSDQLLALRTADQAFAANMQRAGFENIEKLEAIAAGDRDSARRRELVVHDLTPRILAYLTVLGWLAANGVLLFTTIEPTMTGPVMRMLGTLDTVMGMILTYYFGSSVGSARKTEIMANLPKRLQGAPDGSQ